MEKKVSMAEPNNAELLASGLLVVVAEMIRLQARGLGAEEYLTELDKINRQLSSVLAHYVPSPRKEAKLKDEQ